MNLGLAKNYYHYLAIFVIGVILRFYYSTLESYWIDEQIAFYVSDPNLTFSDSLQRSHNSDYSPFLFNFFLKIVFTLFSYSPDLGRYLSVVSGVLSIYFMAYISFIISKKKSLLMVLFLSSFNIFLISYSAETRAYSMIFLLSSINIYLFFKIFILRKNNKIYESLFFFFSLLSLLSHPFTMLIVVSELVFIFFNDFKNKKIKYSNYFIFTLIIFSYLIIEYKYLILVSNYNPPEFFIKNPSLEFFTNFYFNRFFGSKTMGIIYLSMFIFLLIKNKNKLVTNKFYLFLFILFILTYFIPIIYGHIFNPVLKDRYIIFVLIPIILLISSLIYELKEKRLKKFLIIIVFFSTITNQVFELYNYKHGKPDFENIIKKLNKEEVKNIAIITMDKIHPYMMDIQKKDQFRERNIIKNYVKNFDGLDKNFLFYNQDNLPQELNNLWMLCYEAIVAGRCKENIRISKEFKIQKKISSYQIKSFLLKR